MRTKHGGCGTNTPCTVVIAKKISNYEFRVMDPRGPIAFNKNVQKSYSY